MLWVKQQQIQKTEAKISIGNGKAQKGRTELDSRKGLKATPPFSDVSNMDIVKAAGAFVAFEEAMIGLPNVVLAEVRHDRAFDGALKLCVELHNHAVVVSLHRETGGYLVDSFEEIAYGDGEERSCIDDALEVFDGVPLKV